jgi:ADP-L-glycero-D-manno-heptose 6-epimerase
MCVVEDLKIEIPNSRFKSMSVLEKGKIIVTGGAGFIGSALVWALNERGLEDILVVDALDQSEKWKNLASLHFDDYIEADDFLVKIQTNDRVLSDVSTALHLGACSATTERDSAYMMRNNYQYTKEVAQWSLQNEVRFVYASSAATYGDGSQGMSDSAENLHIYRPLNVYGYSKHLFDRYAQKRGWLEKIVGLKYFNVFGPNENHKGDMRSLVNKAYAQVKETGRIELFKSHNPNYKDGEFGRDFLYVKDAAQMTLFLAEHKSANGLFNIGSGQMNTWNELAASVFAAFDLPPDVEYIEMPEAIRNSYQYHTQADLSRLRLVGCDYSITPLREAVYDYVCNYLMNDKRLGD